MSCMGWADTPILRYISIRRGIDMRIDMPCVSIRFQYVPPCFWKLRGYLCQIRTRVAKKCVCSVPGIHWPITVTLLLNHHYNKKPLLLILALARGKMDRVAAPSKCKTSSLALLWIWGVDDVRKVNTPIVIRTICKLEIKYNHNTSNLSTHLRRHHGIIVSTGKCSSLSQSVGQNVKRGPNESVTGKSGAFDVKPTGVPRLNSTQCHIPITPFEPIGIHIKCCLKFCCQHVNQ